ncbi:MAG: GAF domain-containing protein, partial [Acidobacteriota bacterium]|nr:GAF domain-containing protein [Acidobacteriota bacterium]
MSAAMPGKSLEEADLSICAQEPIHIPSSIEPHGVLLVAQEPDLVVVQTSANSKAHLGKEPASVLHKKLSDFVTAPSFQRLESGIREHGLEAKPIRVLDLCVSEDNRTFDATVHRLHGLVYVELEPRAVDASQASNVSYAVMTNMLSELRGADSLRELCQRTAAYIRRLTGFDRVMVYRFLEDDSGEVIAEDHSQGLSPYLGLRYPASDIPVQARQLYIRNPIRLKPDVGAPGAPLIPALNPITGAPLDMSFCILRRMSPVHNEYLRNMGVAASMSLSILKDGRLWGLIACHHRAPRSVTHSTRIACEFLTEFLSSQIGGKEDSDLREHQARHAAEAQRFEGILRESGGLVQMFTQNPREVVSILGAGGAAVASERQVLLTGKTPTAEQLEDLTKWLTEHQHDPVFSTNNLQDHYAPAREFASAGSGLLSIRVTKSSRDFLLWFRPEVSTTIRWAGNPEKPVDVTGEEKRISPRRSFELWKQNVAGHAVPWLAAERHYADSLRNVIAEVMLIRQNDEVTRLNAELSRSNIELDAFAYAASHDLQEPVRTVRSYAQLILRRGLSGPNAQTVEFLQNIIGAADRMTELIGGLLDYARLGGLERMQSVSTSLEETLTITLAGLRMAIEEQRAV